MSKRITISFLGKHLHIKQFSRYSYKNSNIVSYKLRMNVSEKDILFVVFLYKTQGRDGKEIRGMTERKGSFEPRYEKIDFLHMRKQRHRSAAQ